MILESCLLSFQVISLGQKSLILILAALEERREERAAMAVDGERGQRRGKPVAKQPLAVHRRVEAAPVKRRKKVATVIW